MARNRSQRQRTIVAARRTILRRQGVVFVVANVFLSLIASMILLSQIVAVIDDSILQLSVVDSYPLAGRESTNTHSCVETDFFLEQNLVKKRKFFPTRTMDNLDNIICILLDVCSLILAIQSKLLENEDKVEISIYKTNSWPPRSEHHFMADEF
uniref:Uncharacterized protein n=1 Tax=Romanomermis culicivorax TaxID=13658 RepID=A0A915HST4_ROMCU